MFLIVDDDPRFVAQAEALLGGGQSIRIARDAGQARSVLGSATEEVTGIMIDLDLPDEDSFSLIREIRHRFPNVPIVAIGGIFRKDALDAA